MEAITTEGLVRERSKGKVRTFGLMDPDTQASGNKTK